MLRDNLFLLRYMFRHARGFACLSLGTAALVAADNVVSNAVIVTYLYAALGGGAPIQEIWVALGMLAGLLALRYGLRAFQDEWLRPKAACRVRQGMQTELYEKAAACDLADYDDPAHYERFVLAASEADDRAMKAFDTVCQLLSIFLMLLGYAGVMLSLDPVAFLPTAAYVGASFVISSRRVKIAAQSDAEAKSFERRRDWATRAFTQSEYAPDLRVTNAAKPLFALYRSGVDGSKKARLEAGKKLFRLALIDEIALEQIILNGGVYVYLAYQLLVSHTLAPGGMLALAFTIENTTWRMNDLISMIPEFTSHALYARRILDFLAREPKIQGGSAPMPDDCTVAFHNVSFSYGDTVVLKGLSFTLRPGEKLALVGENGAGKSTIVKLLLRLYDPDGGAITMGGVDIRTLPLEAYRARFAAAFQNGNLYALTLAENVSLSAETDPKRVENALKRARFDLPLPLDTPMLREYDDDGVLLSGGERQKIRTARALYRDAPLLVLDEPSAALDPVAEHRFNRAFAEETRGVLFISHRLAAVSLADRIVLVENGVVREEGSHQTLLSQNGPYARMWRAQAAPYQYC